MTPQRKQEILDMIRAAGFTSVTVQFSGGGDEGQYDEMLAVTAAGTQMDIQGYYSQTSSHPELARVLEDETDNYWDWNGGGVTGTMVYDAEHEEITLNLEEEVYVTRPTRTW